MPTNKRALNCGVVVAGLVAATIAICTLRFDSFALLSSNKLVSCLQIALGFWVVPGLIASTLFGGKIHDDNPVVAAIINALLYYFLILFFIRILRRKNKA